MESVSRKPNLQTIADLAGVSRATVSMALRNQACISEGTRTRIQELAESLGYRPNPQIAALMAHIKNSRALPDAGILVFLTSHGTRHGWREYPTLARYFSGARDRAEMAGYRLDEIWRREPGMTSKKMQSILTHRGVQGVLVAPLSRGSGHLSLDVSTFAVGLIGHTVVLPRLHRAVHRHIESLRMAVRHLRHLGYRRIGLAMSALQDLRNDSLWTTAYAGYQLGLPVRQRVPIYPTDSDDDGQLRAWIERWHPDVIISGNSEIMPKLEKMGIALPADLGLAVLDLGPADTGITGIDILPEVVGAAAIDMIVGQIQRNERGIPAQPKLILTEGIWVPGATVRKVSRKTALESSGPALEKGKSAPPSKPSAILR